MRIPNTKIYRKKCRRRNTPGQAHFLTFSCYRRRPFLSKERSCRWLCDAIIQASATHELHVWAYVIMPEHVHLLIYPVKPDYDMGRILSSMKTPVVRKAVNWVDQNAPEFAAQMADINSKGECTLRFWQRGGGHDHNMDSRDEVWEKIEYIHENPVRRKLVGARTQWKWSSAGDFAGKGKGPIPLNWTHLPR